MYILADIVSSTNMSPSLWELTSRTTSSSTIYI